MDNRLRQLIEKAQQIKEERMSALPLDSLGKAKEDARYYFNRLKKACTLDDVCYLDAFELEMEVIGNLPCFAWRNMERAFILILDFDRFTETEARFYLFKGQSNGWVYCKQITFGGNLSEKLIKDRIEILAEIAQKIEEFPVIQSNV